MRAEGGREVSRSSLGIMLHDLAGLERRANELQEKHRDALRSVDEIVKRLEEAEDEASELAAHLGEAMGLLAYNECVSAYGWIYLPCRDATGRPSARVLTAVTSVELERRLEARRKSEDSGFVSACAIGEEDDAE